MTSVQRKRLKRYADFLYRLPSQHFDLNTICKADKNPLSELRENDCGTVACAMGHLPIFNPRAFGFVASEHSESLQTRWGKFEIILNGHNKRNHDAAMIYFGLTLDEVDNLFEPLGYDMEDWKNPKVVADRIYRDILRLRQVAR